jgi:murein DD-endopeptidase MepM/ murein hydrolase activator NlpD
MPLLAPITDSPKALRNVWPVEILPVNGNLRLPVISQLFDPKSHLGVDVMYPGMPGDEKYGGRYPTSGKTWVGFVQARILACAPGVIKYAYLHANGWRVRIEHDSGYDALYLHLSKLDHAFQVGELINTAQVLGLMGKNPLDGEQVYHLHFELRKRDSGAGEPIDPMVSLPLWGRYLMPDHFTS